MLWRAAGYIIYGVEMFFDRLSREVREIDDRHRERKDHKADEELMKLAPAELEREGAHLLAAIVRGRRKFEKKNSG